MYLRRCPLLLLSVFSAVFVLYLAADLRSLQAQTVPPGVNYADDIATKEEIYRLEKLLTEPSRVDSARNVTTKAARSKLPGLSRALVTRGGLAGAAAGVWINNGVMLWNGSQCGQAYCPPPIILDAQFRKAVGTPAESAVFIEFSGSTPVASMMLMSYRWVPTGETTGNATYSFAMKGNARCGGGSCAFTKMVSGSSSYDTANVIRFNDTMVMEPTVSGSISGASVTGQPHMTTNPPGSSTNIRSVGPSFDARSSYTWENPVFDVGQATVVEAPPAITHEYGSASSTGFMNEVGQQGCPTGTVASPEAPPAPEVCPDYFPAEWEEEFDEETDQKPGESPYDDPDQDGKPNHEDPDDDGDEIPDEQDDTPFLPAPTSPGGDPDQDGTPNRDDTDDDGDGIPDEVDPEPYTPTDPADLPEDHPYADPDRDGTPNVNDPDDDGDGREDDTDDQPLMPFWSPRADPDTDGIPNEDDKNDDGDPAEDWEDDNPWSPDTPANPDQDSDEDGVPDWSDPWPGNPYAPTDPSRDEDADQIPDYKDPEPQDPLVPWSPSEFRPERQTSPPNYPDSPWSPSDAPWSPTSPGTPNMPNSPTNPNVPNTPATPEMPGDPSTGTANPPPTRTDVPDDPNTEASPDEPPPPSGPLFVCPAELKPSFVLPPVDFEEKFPFSLILGAKNVLGQLVTTPKAPVFDLPMLGPQDLSRFDGVMSMMRTVWLVILGGILMPIMFYRLIRGSDE